MINLCAGFVPGQNACERVQVEYVADRVVRVPAFELGGNHVGAAHVVLHLQIDPGLHQCPLQCRIAFCRLGRSNCHQREGNDDPSDQTTWVFNNWGEREGRSLVLLRHREHRFRRTGAAASIAGLLLCEHLQGVMRQA